MYNSHHLLYQSLMKTLFVFVFNGTMFNQLNSAVKIIILGKRYLNCSFLCCTLFFTIFYGNFIAQEVSPNEMIASELNYLTFTDANVQHLSFWKKFNSKVYESHPEFGTLSYDAPCSECVEVLDKRKENERYFININDHSEFYQQQSYGALHFMKDGQWITIDSRIKPLSSVVFAAINQFDGLGFDSQNKYSFINTPLGEVSFNQWTLVGLKNNDEQLLAQANWSDFTAGDDGILIHNIFPGIDAEMNTLRGTIKTNFIIRSLDFPEFDFILFRDRFEDSNHGKLSFVETPNLTEGIGTVKFKNQMGTLLEISPAIIYPKGGDKDEISEANYRINNNLLDIAVPVNWISHYLQLYDELIIDPTVTSTNTLAQGSITGSGYNATCFNGFCTYNLTVPTPANATVTDITWSFNYNATSSCWRSNGAVSLYLGTCRSPGATSNFWFCPVNSVGTCTGTNISVMSDFSSCIPPPSCAPQNLNFSMRFHRCWGSGGGCSNTCIGATSPWTMTVTGKTVEVAGNVSILPAVTICQGQCTTLTTTGQFGVAPYIYTWNPGAFTGSPSVCPVSTTTYAVTITDACGVTATATKTITVNPVPTVTVTNATVCNGTAATLTATGLPSGGTYLWNTGATTASITASPSSTTSYTVVYTLASCPSLTGTGTITVNPIPTVTVTNATVCNGTAATLTATGLPSGGTYLWNTGATTSSITASPSSTTSYTVVYTLASCPSLTGTGTITVNPIPTLTVTNATVCNGTAATLTATGLPSGGTYLWSTGATTSSITASPSSTTSYTVVYTLASCPSLTGTGTITVNPIPTLTVTNATVCNGTAATLNATGLPSGGTYLWSTGATTSSITESPSSTTSYTVVYTLASCPSLTGTGTITVNPIPTLTVTNATVCDGTAATLTATGLPSGGTFLWSTGVTTASITASPSSTTSYTVVYTLASCPSLTGTGTITVNPIPTVTVTNATVCNGTTATLTATGLATGGTYLWNTGATTASITASPSSTTSYTVVYTLASCPSLTGTGTITVNPIPTLTVTNATVCDGTAATLTATGLPSGGTFLWSTGVTTASITASPSSTTSYTVVYTLASCPSLTGTGTITVNPIPTLTVTNATVCNGTTATLTATGLATGGTYLWNTGATTASITASPSSTTSYTVVYTLASCPSLTGTGTGTITVNPIPTVTVTNATVCNGTTATLTATGLATGGTYLWNTGATTASITESPSSTTSYTVVYTLASCPSLTGTGTIAVDSLPVVSFLPDITMGCSPLTVNFVNTTPNCSNCAWTISNGSVLTGCGMATTTFTQAGCYDITLTVNFTDGCTNFLKATNLVCVEDPKAIFTASNYVINEFNPIVQFNNYSNDASTYVWNFGDGSTTTTTENPTYNYSASEFADYLVTLIAYSPFGCSDTAQSIIEMQEQLIFYIPNAFTPDNNSFNQTFKPIFTSGFDPLRYTLLIFNRWGEVIFESHNTEIGWDGTYGDNGQAELVQDGIYAYKIEFKSSVNGELKTVIGQVNLIR